MASAAVKERSTDQKSFSGELTRLTHEASDSMRGVSMESTTVGKDAVVVVVAGAHQTKFDVP